MDQYKHGIGKMIIICWVFLMHWESESILIIEWYMLLSSLYSLHSWDNPFWNICRICWVIPKFWTQGVCFGYRQTFSVVQQRVEYCAMVYAQELEESRENGDLNNVFILDYDSSWFMVRNPVWYISFLHQEHCLINECMDLRTKS